MVEQKNSIGLLLTVIYALIGTMVGRLEISNPSPSDLSIAIGIIAFLTQ